MGNLFTRIKETVVADFHSLLDEKEQKNPLSLLNQYLRDCENEVERVRKLVERQYLLKEEFNRELDSAKEMAEKRKHQAEVAQQAGENELYEFAVREAAHYGERASYLKKVYEEAISQLDELERKYEEMKHKLKDMQIKRLELMGRENIARANQKMNSVLQQSEYEGKAEPRFKDLEGYLDRLEQKVSTSYLHSTIDGKIEKLEKELRNNESQSNSGMKHDIL
ncbi:PspA/IM30 family protein [Peribacillus kribbensis]|uniref:PspA/IM30 family protein n=1 Tax=Peribacillus kribbensis TaxID=356658 RepID=UPI000416F5EE|nr:PspA/IM30 family protein [Peribacillus kribbensis]